MRAEKITYVDFGGTKRAETHYFNLMESEMLNEYLFTGGSIIETLQGIVDAQDHKALVKIIDMVIEKSYGLLSEDKKYHDKDPKHFAKFKSSLAYDVFYKKLVLDSEYAIAFIKDVVEKDSIVSVEDLPE